ncbi:fungal-specific transcription factor domain-containing protein [Amylostereum chailletii]|nr:fungal-specific transcription factor domain-containing protein [Amylostereum chailletii]
MSSGDESDDNLTGVRGKRRRALRACDNCRRRKGDGDEHVGSNCSNCATYRLPCSYLESAKKRERPSGTFEFRYIESLENRLEKLEAYIQKINPGADISQVLGPTPVHTRQHPNLQSGDSRSPFALPAGPSSSPALPNSPSNLPHFRDERDLGPDDDDDDDADDEKAVEELRKEFHEINLGKRFFGKSSGVAIVKTALNMKLEASGGRPASTTSSVLWQLHKDKLRDEFWTTHPWEQLLDGTACAHQFPEPDLLSALVDLFFVHINIYKPMLHRPTLEKDIADGLHVRNHAFGGVVLLVCACASRYSDDSRVKLEPEASWHTSGWKWFTQVHLGRKALLTSPSLHDIQAYTLAATFLQGSSVPVSAWTLSGIALRMIQDVGAHRRKVYSSRPTVEGELWKRAFWSLFLIDRWMSSMFGRPCALQDEDFDVEYPVECDDEYWTPSDPTQAFQQPPGKPSRISHFVGLLKLGRILGFAIRTIYAINKSSLGFTGPRWEQHIVAELDSALNKWLDSVPDHLHWDPTRKDDVFFIQSAHLFSTYHMLQITVHRPFIPSPSKPSTLPYPSLSICTNAARLSSNIIDTCLTRMPDRPFYSLQGTAFASGVILLLNLWSAKLSGMPIDITKEMVDIRKCMRLLKSCETRFAFL